MNQREHVTRAHLWLRHILGTITLVLLMLLIIRLTVQDFHINGQSMESTLHDQEFILVNKAAYMWQPPARGDIIVFRYPKNPQEDYIKRIIAIPGDTIQITPKAVTVDGLVLHERYVNKDKLHYYDPTITRRTISSDQYFVMGDNRGNSSDSRDWGTVPRQNIIGKAIVVYWPFGVNNFGLLPNMSDVFAQIR